METEARTRSVEQVLRLMQKSRTSRPPFKLPYTYDEVRTMLCHGIAYEVEYRHREFSLNDSVKKVVNEAAAFLTNGKKFGLLVSGLPGNGKTTLLRAIQNLINTVMMKDYYGQDFAVRIYTAQDIVRFAKTKTDLFKQICECPALAIDDLGEEPLEVLVYGNSINPLIELLSYRYDKQLLTMATTNTANDKIRANYGDRIADRLNEMMQVIIFTNPSYRTQS